MQAVRCRTSLDVHGICYLTSLHLRMSEILFQYEPVNPTTWAYLASLLVIALYFKFNRIWSVRNWDLIGLILLAPALLDGAVRRASMRAASNAADVVEHAGYIWLFAVSGLFMLRLLLDAFMVRRPLLEPNLIGRRADVSRHLAVRVPDGERRHRNAGPGRCRPARSGPRRLAPTWPPRRGISTR